MEKTTLFEKLEEHFGNCVEIVKYGDNNYSLEDTDTYTVIFDTDAYDLVGLDEEDDCMTYFIVLMNKDEFEWCVLQTEDEEYAMKVFEDFDTLPGWNVELRCTKEDVETYKTYDVIRYDHSQFDMEDNY